MISKIVRGQPANLAAFPADFEQRALSAIARTQRLATEAELKWEMGWYYGLCGKFFESFRMLREAAAAADKAGSHGLFADILRARMALRNLGLKSRLSRFAISEMRLLKNEARLLRAIREYEKAGDMMGVYLAVACYEEYEVSVFTEVSAFLPPHLRTVARRIVSHTGNIDHVLDLDQAHAVDTDVIARLRNIRRRKLAVARQLWHTP